MDSRTAFVTHVATVLISAISLKYPYEFIATQLVAGMVAIYSLRELSQRSQLIRSAFYVTLASIAFYMSMELIHEKDFARLEYGMYIYIIINGILLLFAYPLLFLFEKVFGFTSNVTLVELSNTNNELLKRSRKWLRAHSNTPCKWRTWLRKWRINRSQGTVGQNWSLIPRHRKDEQSCLLYGKPE